MEIWKDIPNYEGLYQASTLGRIRTAEGKTTYTERHGVRHWKSRILKGRGDNAKTGKRVGLWKDGKCTDFLVARLVATTFLGEPPKDYTVNHIDGNRMNNSIDNLEWLSRADNIKHGFDTGLYPQAFIRLYNDTESIVFRSMAKASEYLGRSGGYISMCLVNHLQPRDRQGRYYKIEVMPKNLT